MRDDFWPFLIRAFAFSTAVVFGSVIVVVMGCKREPYCTESVSVLAGIGDTTTCGDAASLVIVEQGGKLLGFCKCPPKK